MAVSVVDVQVNSQSAVRNLQQINAASKQASIGVNGLRGAIGGLVGAVSAVAALRFVVVKTAELETQTRSIETLTGSIEKAKQVIQELQQLGAATPFTSTELIDTAKRLVAFGVSAERVVETTKRLGDVAGATSANLGELSLAYGQVIAKGRLQGEELLQFQERGVALQDELRKMYRLSGEEFSDALSDGRISAQAVEVAIQRLTDTGGKYANGAIAQSDTLAGKFSTLTDGVEMIARKLGAVLKPALQEILNLANFVVDSINKALGGVESLGQKAANDQLFNTRARIKDLETAIAAGKKAGLGTQAGPQVLGIDGQVLGGGQPALPGLTFELKQRQQEAKDLENRLRQLRKPDTSKKPPAIPPLLGGDGGKKKTGKSDADRAAEAAAKEAERVSEVIRNRLAEGQLIRVKSELQDKISAAEIAGDQMLAIRLRGMEREITLQMQYAQQLAAEKDLRAQEAIIFEGNTALIANQREIQRELQQEERKYRQNQMDSLKKHIEMQYELNAGVKQQLVVADGIANTMGSGIASAFDALIQGSDNWGQSLQQIASGVLTDIANQLIRIFVIEQAISSIKSFLSPSFSYGATPLGAGGGSIKGIGTFGPNYGFPARAMGGSVMAGQPYLVGERGPELFMPGRSGGIAPAGSFGGGMNVVVNVDASGSNVQGNQGQSKALGAAIASAVQSELIKQKKPGGLLY